MSNIIKVDDNNFEQEVLNSDIPVLVDVAASWCQPCKRMEPILKKFADENLGKIKVCSVDVDDAPNISSKYNIKSVPTFIAFDKGKILDIRSGLMSYVQLSNLFIL
jgi:thioredoxin 1